MDRRDISFLSDLEEVIRSRLTDRPDSSYTVQLVAGGDMRVAQKVGEEATELALATVAGQRDEQLAEAADLIFHLLVLLSVKDIALADVVDVLRRRHGG